MAKSKFVTYECPHCHRQTKLEIVQVDGEFKVLDGKSWYRCSRCKHSVLINTQKIEEAKKTTRESILKEQCTLYRNDKTFSIGEAIYHSEWDDVGKVIRKEKTTSGIQTIVVAFEKVGEKRLIENLPIEFLEENSISQ
ncbi:MAG: hypothetical protein N3A63_00825 [Bacteroidetes bacterium]|nr:hypothetical protein [Bacteroidota bacterium]